MKKICIVTNQSVICNRSFSGIAETVDGLAISLTNDFDVTVITADPKPDFFFNFTKKVKKEAPDWVCANVMKVHYFVLRNDFSKLSSLLGFLRPNIVQFVDFEIPDLEVNATTVYTIDEHFPTKSYDHVIVFSSDWSEYYHCLGLNTGVVTEFFNPATGLFIPAPYSVKNLEGKETCKRSLCARYQLDYDKPLYLYIGRLFWKKGTEYFEGLANEIEKTGGQFLCVGPSDEILPPNIIHINERISPTEIFPFLAGADFYIGCSKEDIGPLMPRHACSYGAIPITTDIRGVRVYFNNKNSIIYTNASETIKVCDELYRNKSRLILKRITCLGWDFSWSKCIKDWISFYNSII